MHFLCLHVSAVINIRIESERVGVWIDVLGILWVISLTEYILKLHLSIRKVKLSYDKHFIADAWFIIEIITESIIFILFLPVHKPLFHVKKLFLMQSKYGKKSYECIKKFNLYPHLCEKPRIFDWIAALVSDSKVVVVVSEFVTL